MYYRSTKIYQVVCINSSSVSIGHRSSRVEVDMLLGESIEKTKNFFHKTLNNLKSFFLREYRKLPKIPRINPFSCGGGKTKHAKRDEFYTDFCNKWESDIEHSTKRQKSIFFELEEPVKQELEKKRKQEKKPRYSMKPQENTYRGNSTLAKKMKELDMVNESDVEHVSDVEEALHYYSQLKSPVYAEIVDNFFMDIYSDLSVPHSAISSDHRIGSIRL